MMPITETEEIELLNLLEQEEREASRKNHLDFMQHCWMKGIHDPLVVGFHTRRICERIDKAIEDFRNGKSTYLVINVHHRAGKSDIVSRYLGAHFLGEFPDQEVMQVTYQANLAASFSTFGRNVFRSDKFQELYPNIHLSHETNKKNEWVIVDNDENPTGGKLYASGLQSGLTGNGYALGVLDDYFAGRAEAESKVQRDNAWDAFTDDFMTRRAPVSIVIVLATQWHWDDISGRIRNEAEKNADFPQFESIRFPARARDYPGREKYPGEFLFLERYNREWYVSQYATLGRYSSAALMDCDPQMRTGGVLSTDGIVWYDRGDWEIPSETNIQWARIWDLAHTAKQRSGDDPDYTSGTLIGFERRGGDPILHLWIKHRVRLRAGAVKRDETIELHAEKDGKFVKQAIENTVESKDAYEYICKNIPGYNWQQINISGDKLARAAPLEPIFEAPGHVHVLRGDWNDEWLDEIVKFTGTGNEHDDGIDNLSAGYIMLVDQRRKLSPGRRAEMAARRNR